MKTKLHFLILLLFFLGIQNPCFSQNYIWAKSLAGRGISTLDNLTPGASNGEAIAVDSIGNIYIVGYCNDTVDFDPSVNNVFLKGGNDDAYIAKYDSAGNYMWAHVFKSTGGNFATHLKIDKQGNLVITGNAQATADFDPGPNTLLLGVLGSANYLFIAKYNTHGNLIWATEIGNNFGTFCGGLDIDLNNNIFITGYFYGTLDMDPSSATAQLISDKSGIFTAKYDQNGNYKWANCLSGIGNLGTSLSIACSVNGNVFIAGLFGNTVDFNPSVSTFNITANTTCDRFFMKYDNYGNFVWVKSFDVNENGYLNTDRMIKIVLDVNENSYITGNFLGTVDFNPGAGVFTISSPLTTSSYICKYNPAGQFLWAKGLIGGVVQTTDIVLDCQNNICLAGSFSKADFDPSPAITQVLSNAPSAFNNFYAKYNQNGDLIWVKQIGNNGYGGSTLSVNIALKNEHLYIVGGFKQTGVFNEDGTATLQATGVGQNTFFAKYSFQNTVNLLHDTTLCVGDEIILDASGIPGNYVWQNQSTNPTFEVSQAGNYWVQITNQNCKTTDSVNVKYNTINPLSLNDTIFCEGSTVTLNAENKNATYVWQDSSTYAQFEVSKSGTYWVKITVANCSLFNTVTIETKECEIGIEYPNIFSPNNDGINETFVPIKINGIVQPQLFIYNRWGQKVFETTNIKEGWNGKINNLNANTGVYFWVLNYATIEQQQLHLTGYVTLVN